MSMDAKHEMLVELARLTEEIGAVPTRAQWRASAKISADKVNQVFGGFSLMLQAAGYSGMDLVRARKKQITEAFTQSVHDRLSEHKPVGILPLGKRRRILVLGDTHFPWAHQEALSRVYSYLDKHTVDAIVQVGDLFDLYAYSRFPRSQLGMDPKEEIDAAQAGASEMWKQLKTRAPNAECYQLLGNHSVRPHRLVLAKAPELEHLVALGMRHYYQFNGVKTLESDRQELLIDDVLFIHGWGSKPGQHRDHFMHNTVLGHTHKLNASFRTVYDPVTESERTLIEANAGMLADPRAKVFGYTPSRVTGYTLGFLVFDEYGPHCVAF